MQSPYHKQRSIVALLADSTNGFTLLNNTLTDKTKRSDMFGSVIVIRDSGIKSLRVGDVYYVGYLPWWEQVWFSLRNQPLTLALATLLVAILIAAMLWGRLKAVNRKRLKLDEQD